MPDWITYIAAMGTSGVEVIVVGSANFILMENSDFILAENSDLLILES